jgi:hypothetical protein
MAFDISRPRDARGRFVSASRAASMLEEVGVFASDIEGWIMGSEAVRWAKLAKAEEVKAAWQAIAPIRGDKPTHDSKLPTAYGTNVAEDYRNSIRVEENEHGVRVGTDLNPLADWLEYGSIHNPEHGYGARVLAEFGGGPVDEGARITKNLYVG